MIKKPKTHEAYEDLMDKARDEGKTAVLYFSGEHCGPCQAMHPTFTKIAKKYPKQLFIEIDVETDFGDKIANTAEIEGVPTLLLWRNDEVLDEEIGYADGEDDIKESAALLAELLDDWIKGDFDEK